MTPSIGTDPPAPCPNAAALQRAARVLAFDPAAVDVSRGYVDLMAGQGPVSAGCVQRLMHTSFVPALYERWWRPVLGRAVKGPAGPSMAQETRLAVGLAGVGRGATVLDVACGPGNLTRPLAAAAGDGGVVVGVDASATMLAKAVRATARQDSTGSSVVYVHADVDRLPVRPDSLDAVCCFAALHLFADPWATLDTMARALVPGGRLVILTTARRAGARSRGVVDAAARAMGVQMFDPDDVATHAAASGLRVDHHDVFGVMQLIGARRPPDGQAADHVE